jgi:hypothetical protein
MEAEQAAPCRHAGAPPEAVVARVSSVIQELGSDAAFLASRGLTSAEYALALPAALESLRGSRSASTSGRRQFLRDIFQALLDQGLISGLAIPAYGDDTVYRLSIPGFGDVAVIQKGCPDGAHSSVRWSAPDWARETYLWWLCSSLVYEPGEHIAKGCNRLRQRFFSNATDSLDGVIFHNELCGSPDRPCPKASRAVSIAGTLVPPPCVYIMPEHAPDASQWNWNGGRLRAFPGVLLSLFGIDAAAEASYVGYVGFQRQHGTLRTTISSRFGPGRSTIFRK